MAHDKLDPTDTATREIPTYPVITGTEWVVTFGAGGTGSPKVVAVTNVNGQNLGTDVAGRGIKLTLKDAILISAAPSMLAALRKVPLFGMTEDALGWRCAGCGRISGIHPDGSNREESCAPDCYVTLVEAAIAKAGG